MSQPVQTAVGMVTISCHAIDRYVERVKPAYSPTHAHWELARILPLAEVSDFMPAWAEHGANDNSERYETDCFLVLCESVAFPVFDGIVLTTLVRGSVGPVARRARTQARRRRHSVHRAIKVNEKLGIVRRARKAQKRSDDWKREAA